MTRIDLDDLDWQSGATSVGHRKVLFGLAGGLGQPLVQSLPAKAEARATTPVNLAKVAKASSGYVSGDTSPAALNKGAEPK